MPVFHYLCSLSISSIQFSSVVITCFEKCYFNNFPMEGICVRFRLYFATKLCICITEYQICFYIFTSFEKYFVVFLFLKTGSIYLFLVFCGNKINLTAVLSAFFKLLFFPPSYSNSTVCSVLSKYKHHYSAHSHAF